MKLLPIEDDDFFIACRNSYFYWLVKEGADPNSISFVRAINENTNELGCAVLIDKKLASTMYPSEVN